MKTFEINLTKKDIQQGEQGNNMCCPIALCVHRKTGKRFRVRPNSIVTQEGNLVVVLPKKAQQFIYRFDRSTTKKIKPISFNIDIPNSFLI